MSVISPVVQLWDGANRRIYLKQGVSNFYPIDDIYKEYRHARKTDENLRKYNSLLKAEGNVPKGAGAFTPRYVVLLEGTKIVPFDETLQLNQLGDMITDNPDVDATLYDVSGLTHPKPIFIKPSEAETIQLNQTQIQYSSYQNGVWVDSTNGQSGVGFPIGTREFPVKTFEDAITIANVKGFDTIYLLGSGIIRSGVDVTGFRILGNNPVTSLLTIEQGAICNSLYIRELSFQGVLCDGAILRDCEIRELHYFNGYLEHCALTSNTVFINGVGIIANCFAGATCIAPPTLDMTNATGLAVRNFNGSFKISNKTGNGNCEISLDGKLIVDSTVTGGTFIVYGDGYVENNGTGTSNVVDRTTGTPLEIAEAVWNKVMP